MEQLFYAISKYNREKLTSKYLTQVRSGENGGEKSCKIPNEEIHNLRLQ